jgi:hypothetical protein
VAGGGGGWWSAVAVCAECIGGGRVNGKVDAARVIRVRGGGIGRPQYRAATAREEDE